MKALLERVVSNDAECRNQFPDIWPETQDQIEEDARALLAKIEKE